MKTATRPRSKLQQEDILNARVHIEIWVPGQVSVFHRQGEELEICNLYNKVKVSNPQQCLHLPANRKVLKFLLPLKSMQMSMVQLPACQTSEFESPSWSLSSSSGKSSSLIIVGGFLFCCLLVGLFVFCILWSVQKCYDLLMSVKPSLTFKQDGVIRSYCLRKQCWWPWFMSVHENIQNSMVHTESRVPVEISGLHRKQRRIWILWSLHTKWRSFNVTDACPQHQHNRVIIP